jgi:hypothetical protein
VRVLQHFFFLKFLYFNVHARRTRLSQVFDVYRGALVGAPPQHFFSKTCHFLHVDKNKRAKIADALQRHQRVGPSIVR